MSKVEAKFTVGDKVKRVSNFSTNVHDFVENCAYTVSHVNEEEKTMGLKEVHTVGLCPFKQRNFAFAESTQHPVTDLVNSPPHYQSSSGIECIEAVKAQMSDEEYRGYLRGNVVKYLWRYQQKGGKQSLEKARWYLDKLIGQTQ